MTLNWSKGGNVISDDYPSPVCKTESLFREGTAYNEYYDPYSPQVSWPGISRNEVKAALGLMNGRQAMKAAHNAGHCYPDRCFYCKHKVGVA
jgi:hypothetical protein